MNQNNEQAFSLVELPPALFDGRRCTLAFRDIVLKFVKASKIHKSQPQLGEYSHKQFIPNTDITKSDRHSTIHDFLISKYLN